MREREKERARDIERKTESSLVFKSEFKCFRNNGPCFSQGELAR